MADHKSLYFIAIIPPDDISEEIMSFKNDFAINYKSKRGLRILPHITLQMPFFKGENEEPLMKEWLTEFAKTQFPLIIRLDGFGYFLNNRSDVVFVKLLENPDLWSVHKELMLILRNKGFTRQETKLNYNPHLTIAYRDLKRNQFLNAWSHYENRPYQRWFKVNEIHLLKHNGKQWQSLEKFRLTRTHR